MKRSMKTLVYRSTLKTIVLVASLLGCFFIVSCSKDDQEDPNDKVYRDQKIVSKQMNQTMKYSVWLPKGYDSKKSYPFLYLLHGIMEDNNSWMDKGRQREIARDYIAQGGTPMVIVMPDGQATFYTNCFFGNWESYFHEELMPKVEKKFHCNGKRAVAGFSMGGFGTLYNALNHPDEFLYAYAMSPDTVVGAALGNDDLIALAEDWEAPSVFPPIIMEIGTDDIIISIDSVRKFSSQLEEAGIQHTLVERPGGHDWEFWMVCLEHALDEIGEAFK